MRREREELERQASVLRNTAHDLSDEVSNLDRRVEASARIVKSLDKQLSLISDEVDTASARMVTAERELAGKREILHRRVIDVYKRGPLFSVEAMLSAHSFGELVARYKYLHELTLHDRALVQRVELLRNEVSGERDRLVTLQMQLGQSRRTARREGAAAGAREREQADNLRVVRQQAKQLADRIERQNRSIAQMEATIAALEAARKRADAARPVAARATSSIKTSDYGKLDWPVDGPLVYTFGKSLTASNATIHWNGVGIRAALGHAGPQRRGRESLDGPVARHLWTDGHHRPWRRRLHDLRIAPEGDGEGRRGGGEGRGHRRRRQVGSGAAGASALRDSHRRARRGGSGEVAEGAQEWQGQKSPADDARPGHQALRGVYTVPRVCARRQLLRQLRARWTRDGVQLRPRVRLRDSGGGSRSLSAVRPAVSWQSIRNTMRKKKKVSEEESREEGAEEKGREEGGEQKRRQESREDPLRFAQGDSGPSLRS